MLAQPGQAQPLVMAELHDDIRAVALGLVPSGGSWMQLTIIINSIVCVVGAVIGTLFAGAKSVSPEVPWSGALLVAALLIPVTFKGEGKQQAEAQQGQHVLLGQQIHEQVDDMDRVAHTGTQTQTAGSLTTARQGSPSASRR